jgi:NDP-sugar pyrophosphorylase family protein
MKKQAVILCGGKGKRLRPYTIVLPKPLMPVGEYPILEVIIRQLALQGFDQITLAVNHQAELITAFFGNGSKWNIAINYSLEDEPLGTMGPLKLINDLPEHLSKAKYSKKVVALDRFSQSGADSQVPMSSVSQHNRDKQ